MTLKQLGALALGVVSAIWFAVGVWIGLALMLGAKSRTEI